MTYLPASTTRRFIVVEGSLSTAGGQIAGATKRRSNRSPFRPDAVCSNCKRASGATPCFDVGKVARVDASAGLRRRGYRTNFTKGLRFLRQKVDRELLMRKS